MRDITNNPESRVVSITSADPVTHASVIITQSATGAAVGDYIILRRVRDDDGIPVQGSYLVSAIGASGGFTAYTVANGPTQTVTTPNGTARTDKLVLATYTGGQPNRLVARKVGRPFQQYRGRRSRQRA